MKTIEHIRVSRELGPGCDHDYVTIKVRIKTCGGKIYNFDSGVSAIGIRMMTSGENIALIQDLLKQMAAKMFKAQFEEAAPEVHRQLSKEVRLVLQQRTLVTVPKSEVIDIHADDFDPLQVLRTGTEEQKREVWTLLQSLVERE